MLNIQLAAIGEEVKNIGTDIGDMVKNNPLLAVGAGVATVGVVGGVVAAVRSTAKKKSTKRKSKLRKSRIKSKRKPKKSTKKRKYKYARTAGKGKDTSTRRIRQTKKGQPYIILKSGKAKFISKKSAALSRKRKGGRY